VADEYLDIANGDVRIANALRRIILNLAENGTGMLQEMARDVVNGGSLRAALFSGVYAEELDGPFRNFWSAYQDMSVDEREELQAETRKYLDSQNTPGVEGSTGRNADR
jgi:hypothetical protein